MKRYDPQEIEPKWQKVWADTGLHETPEHPGQDKYYCLVMFPYPSGDLHSGHWYNFGPADTYARFQRMHGKKVLHPIGFDAFGLPAENAAIKRGIEPAKWTDQNIASMRKQLEMLGAMYDWDRLVDTSKPEYYKWTQWLFLKLYEKGLAYRAKGLQNWCPKDQTVLANEQVVGEDNHCERCGTPVIKKELEQWFFRITDYADRLLEDLGKVTWPERVKTMQENWIGRSEGARIEFAVDGSKDVIEVFTTRPDTIFGATYMVLAPEHPLVDKITTPQQKAEVEKYVKAAANKTELDRLEEEGKDKTGAFTGAYAINPANDEKIPVWISDYVLMGYGTGAIMAVPAHDERDGQFARKFDLPIRVVVEPVTGDEKPGEYRRSIVAIVRNHEGQLLSINWGPKLGGNIFVGGGCEEGEDLADCARREVAEETGYKNLKLVATSENINHHYYAHSKKVQRQIVATGFLFELENDERDEPKLDEAEQGRFKVEWISADQARNLVTDPLHRYLFDKFIDGRMYTGEGPLTNSGQFDGLRGVEAKRAIVEHLYKTKQGKGETQYRLRDWLISRQRYWGAPIPVVYCDKDGIVPVPEDQLPVELPLDVKFEPTGQSPLGTLPDFFETKCPKCGGQAKRETDTMDTFVDSSWYFLRYPNNHYAAGPFDPEAVKEWAPVDQYIGGVEHAILHLLYARFITKVLYDDKLVDFDEPFRRLFNQGIILGPDGQKMSKSRGNVVNPDDWVSKYGADTFRMYLMFMGPYDQGGPFDTKGIAGVSRFLHRVWALVRDFSDEAGDAVGRAGALDPSTWGEVETALAGTMHRTIKKVTDDIASLGFNTAIASLMENVNELYRFKTKLGFADAPDAWRAALQTVLMLLAPLAPHMTEELWAEIGDGRSIHLQPWPQYDEGLVKEDLVAVVVQVNGKLRTTITVPVDAGEEEMKKLAAEQDNVAKFIAGKAIVKTVVVPRKLVNFVVKD